MGAHTQLWMPAALSRVEELRCGGQREHFSDDAADVLSTKDPAGQYESINNSADCRPSASNIATFQLDIGGPLSPGSSGPHTNEMVAFDDTLWPVAARVKVLDVEGEVSRQLLLRKLGSLAPEKEARGVPSSGNEPVTVIEAWPSCEIALGATRRDAGE